MDSSPNPVLILDKHLKPISHPVEFADALFPVYKQNNSVRQNIPSLLSTEDLLKWSNDFFLNIGMGNACYPSFVLLTMD